MLFLIVLIITLALSCLLSYSGILKKHSTWVYLVALAINLVTTYFWFTDRFTQGAWSLPMIVMKQGLVGMALFVIIMYIGAIPVKGPVATLFKVRGELSILAVIFMVNHGVYYMHNLIKSAGSWMELGFKPLLMNLLVSLLSLWAWAICIPLFITSFKAVRRKMNAKEWKKIQRYAYMFYGLVYVHILLAILNRPGWQNYVFTIFVYTAIFFSYAYLRLKKWSGGQKLSDRGRKVVLASANISLILLGLISGGLVYGYVDQMKSEDLGAYAEEKVQEKKVEAKAEGEESYYKDGTYQGTGKGYKSQISVQVTIKDDAITDVKILSHGDDEAYLNSASKILESIRKSNSTDVDTVSGATFSSNGILSAVNNALDKAVR